MLNATLAPSMKRIVLVEDSPIIRESLVDMLNDGDENRVIGTADTEDDAFDLISHYPADVAIIDINLREGSGIGLLARLRTLERSPTLIVYTNHYNRRLHDHCTQLGAAHVLSKSGDFNELLDALEAVDIGH